MVSAAERIVALEAIVAEFERHLAAAWEYTDTLMRIADQEGDDSGSVGNPPEVIHEIMQRAVKEILSGNTTQPDRADVQHALDKAPKDKTPFPVNTPSGDPRRIGG